MYEATGVAPHALANRPVMLEVWEWPYSVWAELSGSRAYSESGPSEVLFSEVAMYGTYHFCTFREIAELWRDVHKIDQVWMAEVAKIKEAQAQA